MSCCLPPLRRKVLTSSIEELSINAEAQAVLKYKNFNRRLSARRERTDTENEKSERKDFISEKMIRFIYTNALFYLMIAILCPWYDYMQIFNYCCASLHWLGVYTSLVFRVSGLWSGKYDCINPPATVAPGETRQAVRIIQCICHEGVGIYHLSGSRCTDVTCTSQPADASVTVWNE